MKRHFLKTVIALVTVGAFGLALANCALNELEVAARRFMDAVHDEPIETQAGPVGVRVSTIRAKPSRSSRLHG